jgi:hypothetical protein
VGEIIHVSRIGLPISPFVAEITILNLQVHL